ncbi:MAG: sugar phosphate isomerase/epimerase family protein [Phototrophicaceae bacterium]
MMNDIPPIRELHAVGSALPTMLQLAIDEGLLIGKTDTERIAFADQVGARAIEFNALGLHERVPGLRALFQQHGVTAAAVRVEAPYDFLAPDEAARQQALDALRHAMTDAVDLGASSVVLVPHYGALQFPDLMPYKAPIQLAVELMVTHLRSLSDLAYVFGVQLMLLPLNRYETGFLNRLDQAVELRRRIKFHQHVWAALDWFHAAQTEDDPLQALQTQRDSIRHVYLSAANGTLPGVGQGDFSAVRAALADTSGWAVLTHHLAPDADRPTANAIRNALAHLQQAGFSNQ